MNIKCIDIVHFTHTDFGYTDHQIICQKMRTRYIDEVVNIASLNYNVPNDEHFYWTCETTIPVLEWWNNASKSRRRTFIKLVKDGFIDVGALPFNVTPFISAEEWDKLMDWVPNNLWKAFRPRTIIQNDINGFSSAGAIRLHNRGLRHLWMAINKDLGATPFPAPTPFIWKLSGDKKIFCYQAIHYMYGYFYFHRSEWRKSIPKVSNTMYRYPDSMDIFKTDELSLREANKICNEMIMKMENKAYPYKRLIISFTNMRTVDNDPPVSWIGKFVSAWNKAGLLPKLRLTTVSEAMRALYNEKNAEFPVYAGEWPDWWANGAASTPRELSLSRQTKRTLVSLENSPLFKLADKDKKEINACWKDICLFDEHTWGASESIFEPYSIATIGQEVEKHSFAYRPFEMSRFMLSDKIRTKLSRAEKGVYLINPDNCDYTGWVYLNEECLRGDYNALEDCKTGEKIKFITENKKIKFWIENLKQGEIIRFHPIKSDFNNNLLENNFIDIKEDPNDWPISAKWNNMEKPLYVGDIGGLIALNIKHPFPRDEFKRIFNLENNMDRLRQSRQQFKYTHTVASKKASRTENEHTIIYEQYLAHSSMEWFYRKIELFKDIPKVSLKIRFYRKSSPQKPEIFYVKFSFPFKNEKIIPIISCGGFDFKPEKEQLPNSCRDYYAIDGWVKYKTKYGEWLWYGRDSALVTFGQPSDGTRQIKLSSNTEILLSIVFNNVWNTNWACDEHGVFEFNYEMVWNNKISSLEPIVFIK